MAVGRLGDDFIKSAHHPNIMTGISVELDENFMMGGKGGKGTGSKYSKRAAADQDGIVDDQIEFNT